MKVRFDRRVTPSEKLALEAFFLELRRPTSFAGHQGEIPTGVAFTLGDIPVMKCAQCGVTRELSSFWRRSGTNTPAAAVSTTCTYCR